MDINLMDISLMDIITIIMGIIINLGKAFILGMVKGDFLIKDQVIRDNQVIMDREDIDILIITMAIMVVQVVQVDVTNIISMIIINSIIILIVLIPNFLPSRNP